jgi:hypothetical protein
MAIWGYTPGPHQTLWACKKPLFYGAFSKPFYYGGEGGIRTPDRLAPMPQFNCGAGSCVGRRVMNLHPAQIPLPAQTRFFISSCNAEHRPSITCRNQVVRVPRAYNPLRIEPCLPGRSQFPSSHRCRILGHYGLSSRFRAPPKGQSSLKQGFVFFECPRRAATDSVPCLTVAQSHSRGRAARGWNHHPRQGFNPQGFSLPRFDLVLLPKCYGQVRLAAAGASVYAQTIELPDVFLVAGEGLEPPTPGL